MADWDAARYHRISSPQFDWGQRVIARLQPAAGERVLDLGCGTGRLTALIQRALAGGRAVGLDASGAMLAVARASDVVEAGRQPAYVRGSGVALPFRGAFDAVFSSATLHWIHDHDAVFASVRDALKPGGRFVAQCGGKGNLQRLLSRAAELMTSRAYAPYYDDWRDPWHFADAETTVGRLERAGFTGVEAWLEEAPVELPSGPAYSEFVSCVCIRHHLERLPLNLREPFVNELSEPAARDPRPFLLDYRRLNITARAGA
jgi:ubiquinone/menaquinone biosynthesis C-methylase UbiE